MDKILTLPSALIARLLNKQTFLFNQACASITIRALLKGYSLDNIYWLCQQIALETAWGQSNSLEVDANAWGMNCVSTRETTQIACRETPSGEVLGQYSNIGSSCADRLLWDKYWGYDSLKRDSTYGQVISEKYHTSPSYATSVSSLDIAPIRIAVWTAILTIPLELYLLSLLFKKIF